MRYSQLFSSSLEQFHLTGKGLDVQILMEEVFNLSRTQFFLKKNDPVDNREAIETFYGYLERLAQDEPVAYILGKKEFYGETFEVTPDVLIPRPETEILVEKAVELLKAIGAARRVLDIGAGSGIISIMLAKLAGATVTAVDISPAALAVLKRNIAAHHVQARVFPLQADVFPLPAPQGDDRYHLVVSNPPYIPEQEWRHLDLTVKKYEPKTALAAGEDGLDIIRRIASGAHDYLVPGGSLMMEIGYNQSHDVAKILEQHAFRNIDFIKDYNDISRIARAELKN